MPQTPGVADGGVTGPEPTGAPGPDDVALDPAALGPLLFAALEQTTSAACVTTADLDPPGPEIVYVNPAYCEMTGRARASVMGETPRIMQGPLTDREVLDRLRSDLGAGRTFTGETVNYRADGTPFIISWRIDAVQDEHGETTHYVATQNDVTRLRRAERRATAESRIDQATSTAIEAAARSDGDEHVDAFLATCADAVAEMTGATAVVSATVAGRRRTSASEGSGGAVVDRATTSLPWDRHSDATDEHRAEAQRGIDDGSGHWIAVGLPGPPGAERAGGHVAVRGMTAEEAAFADVAALGGVRGRIAAALAAIREYEWQRQSVIELQSALLPVDVSAPGLRCAHRYRPGTTRTLVGGDWFDGFQRDGRAVMVVGDVAGSGLAAASAMGRLRMLARIVLERSGSLAEAIAEMDHVCHREGAFATLVAAEVDPATGNIELISAGHPPPLVVTPGRCTVVDLTPAAPLGTRSRRTPVSGRVVLARDATVLLYTDGAVERRDEPVDSSIDRVCDLLGDRSPDGPDAVCDAVLASLDTDMADDVALLAFDLASRPGR